MFSFLHARPLKLDEWTASHPNTKLDLKTFEQIPKVFRAIFAIRGSFGTF
jgi:hypothetical protein